MRVPALLASMALLGAPYAPAHAQPTGDTQVVTSPAKASAQRTQKVVATVAKLDVAARMVTLQRADGRLVPMQLGPEVRNLDRLSVGDKVVVQYLESLSLTLKKNGKELPTANVASGGARTPKGDLPGGLLAEQIEVTADVIAVDTARQVVTLKGPQQTVEMRVQDPQQLKLIKVGDQVQAIYTQALAVAVEPAPPARK